MKKLLGILAITCLSLTASAQEKTANSLLWKIEKNDIEKPSYIYGTYHIMCEDSYHFSNVLKETIKKADIIAIETNITDSKAMLEMQKSMMKIEKPLTDFMNDKEEKIVNDYLMKKMKMPLAAFNNIKPIGLLLTLSLSNFPCDMSAAKSYEKDIMALAKEHNKDMFYFETLKEQWAFLDALPDDKEVDQLIEYVEKADEQNDMLSDLLKIYKNQNIESLFELSVKEFDAEALNRLLTSRNERWISKINKQAKDKSMFIAVGAAHLGGPKGVLKLLKKEGYTVTPIFQ